MTPRKGEALRKARADIIRSARVSLLPQQTELGGKKIAWGGDGTGETVAKRRSPKGGGGAGILQGYFKANCGTPHQCKQREHM